MSGTRLPNAGIARIADAKLRDFILNAIHPDNNGRAAFYIGIGFAKDEFERLRDALLEHPQSNTVMSVSESAFGTKYRVRSTIKSPDGRNPCIDTVWVIDGGSSDA